MGWTPKRDDATGSGEGNPSPAPRRRRRKPPEEPTPNLDKAVADMPRTNVPARPPAGRRAKDDTRSSGIRLQVGKRWAAIIADVKHGEYSWSEFCDGLDEEELARGQLRADDGSFVGRPPQFVPREFHLACQREMKRRFETLFSTEVIGMTEEFLRLCKSATIPDKDRAKLLQYAMERVFGGIPKDVRVSAEQPWEQMVANVMRGGDDTMPEHLERRYAGYRERQGDTDGD